MRDVRHSLGNFVGLPDAVLIADSEFSHIVERSVVNIEVYIALDAGKTSHVGVLPEFPRSFVFHLIYIVMGYPVRIVVKDGGVEITLLKFIICVDDGFDVITVLNNMEPCENVALEVFHGTVFGHVFDVENWRQVTFFKVYVVEEEVCLVACRRLVAPKMVGSAYVSILACLSEVVAELAVHA